MQKYANWPLGIGGGEEGGDFGGGNAEFEHGVAQLAQGCVEEVGALEGHDGGRGVVGQVVAHAAARIDYALALHLLEGVEHSAVVDGELHSELAQGGYPCAREPVAGKNARMAEVDDLPEYWFICLKIHRASLFCKSMSSM